MATNTNDIVLQKFQGQVQQQDLWCWAAVCASVVDFYSSNPGQESQCELASRVLGWPDARHCCQVAADCDTEYHLSDALSAPAVNHLGTWYEGDSDAIPGGIASVNSQIGTHHRPVVVRIEWPDGGLHALAIYGVGGNQEFVMWDPSGQDVQTDNLQRVEDFGLWLDTYFTR